MKSERFVIHFPAQTADKPIIYNLTKRYNIAFNILLAKIMPNEAGLMVAELSGDDENFDAGIDYLHNQGIDIQLLKHDISRDENKCIQCGACTTICPTGALFIPDRKTMEVIFNPDECVACSLCVSACPPRAMSVVLNGFEGISL